MLKNKITWVVIADGSRAKLLFKKNGHLTKALPTHHLKDDVVIHIDKGASTPGKTSFSILHGLHSYPTHSDWYKFKKEVFVQKVAAILNKTEKKYNDLELIASPFVLGCLRKQLSTVVKSKITCEINEDLTKLPLKKVLKIVTERVWI